MGWDNQPYNTTPLGWRPYFGGVDNATRARQVIAQSFVSNPVMPGHAYGTAVYFDQPGLGGIMNKNPYTIPVQRNFTTQVPSTAQIQGVTPNPDAAIRLSGYASPTAFPTIDISARDAMYNYLNSLRRS